MARSPSHKFGQIIGEAIERGVVPLLEEFAGKNGLFLDRGGPRACRKGRKCTWTDMYGNKHDLDFVLERGGTPEKTGSPVAFIETAWRRYTKHSKNKAQEIEGALIPLRETHRDTQPLLGAMLAGEFTGPAVDQLRSRGFKVLHFPYVDVVAAFQQFGIDASSDEKTPDPEFRKKVRAYERLSVDQKTALARKLVAVRSNDVRAFMDALAAMALRQVERVEILPLYGVLREVRTLDDALRFLQTYREAKEGLLQRYEIRLFYNNGDQIQGSFKNKDSGVAFLHMHGAAAR